MADCTLSGTPIIQGMLLLKRRGNWCLWVEDLGGTDAPTGSVTGSWLGSNFSGTVLRSGSADGRVSAVVVGGKGGGEKTLPSKMYDYSIPSRIILQDILSDAGETLSTSGDQTAMQQALRTEVPRYVRAAGTLCQQLDQLVAALPQGTVWRILLDGTIWVGTDAWKTAADFDHKLADTWTPASGVVPLLPEAVGILPGQLYEGPGRDSGISLQAYAGDVVYRIDPDSATAAIYRVDPRALGSDSQISQMLRSVIQEELRPTDWHRVYPSRVITQRSDGTLDVEPDDKSLPPLTSVAVRVPVPGAKLKVPADARCDVIFEGGDPARPVAGTFGAGSGGHAAARVDDEVEVDLYYLTGVDPDGGTFITSISAGPLPPPAVKITLKGRITKGSPDLSLP